MRKGLINRKPANKDANPSDLEREHEKLKLALYVEPYSGTHPAKHWAFAKIDPPTMKAIGEEPEEFAKFRDEFRNPIRPNDDFEDLLACKMVAARWRQFRLLRAEAAILAQGRCQFVMERRRQGFWPSPLVAQGVVRSAAAGSERAKPECPLDSESLGSRLHDRSRIWIADRRWPEGSERTKPECPLDSESLSSRLHDRSRIWIVDRRRLIGLVSWVTFAPVTGPSSGR